MTRGLAGSSPKNDDFALGAVIFEFPQAKFHLQALSTGAEVSLPKNDDFALGAVIFKFPLAKFHLQVLSTGAEVSLPKMMILLLERRLPVSASQFQFRV